MTDLIILVLHVMQQIYLHVRRQLNLSFEEEQIHKHTDKETQMCLAEES